MKRVWLIIPLLVALASPGLRAAATSRGFTSTQTYNNVPGGGPGALWFSIPLSSTNKATGLKNVPAAPAPKKTKSASDSRNIYDGAKVDLKKVNVTPKTDDGATSVKPKTVKSKFDAPVYTATKKAPNSSDITRRNNPGDFFALPTPKPRKHGFGEWP